jgi:hypothetical protein
MSDTVIPGALPPPTLKEQMDIIGPYGVALLADVLEATGQTGGEPPMTCVQCGGHYVFGAGHECPMMEAHHGAATLSRPGGHPHGRTLTA